MTFTNPKTGASIDLDLDHSQVFAFVEAYHPNSHPSPFIDSLLAQYRLNGHLSPTQWYYLANRVVELRKSQEENPERFLTPGIYIVGDMVYRVQESRESHLYAMRFDPKKGWVYERGVVRKLTSDDRATLEKAQEYGRRTKRCAVCGRLLTNAESVARGIGPICAQAF